MTILNDILDYSKIEAGAETLTEVTFSPADLLNDIALLMAPSAQEKGLALHLDLPAALPEAVIGDMGKLRQILFNLVSNAVKFTDRGEIRLGVAASGPADRPRLTFTVTDTGKGIATGAQGRVFGAFEQEDAQTARQYGGTGLGLAICKRFADAMGARLAVQSVAGAGSTFTLATEFALGVAADLPAGPVAAVQPGTRTLAALVVEDNDINQMVIQTYLEDMGHTAHVVPSAEGAMAALHDGRFDVILMDVNLPGLSGTAATRQIRALADARIAGLPIIGVSAHVQEADIRENLAAGMSAMLAKPLSPEALQAALHAHVPQTHALQTLAQDIGEDRAAGLARVFVGGLPKNLAALTAAARSDDPLALSRATHQLKGAAGNFDLPDLTAHLARLETLAEAGPSAALDACVRALPDAVDQAARQIDAALDLLDASPSQAAQ